MIHFIPLVSLIPPENIKKPMAFWCFQGVKETSDMKWVKFLHTIRILTTHKSFLYFPFIAQYVLSKQEFHQWLRYSRKLWSTQDCEIMMTSSVKLSPNCGQTIFINFWRVVLRQDCLLNDSRSKKNSIETLNIVKY